MSIRTITAATAATFITLAAGSASAATYDLTRQNSNTWFSFPVPVMTTMKSGTKSVTTQIGGYALTATDTETEEAWDFVGWCVDLFVPLTRNGTDPYIAEFNTSGSEPAGLPGAGNMDLVESFFRRSYDPAIATDATLAAGWQLAIWELLYETSAQTPTPLSDGTFRTSEHTGTKTVGTTVISSSKATEEAAWDAADGFLGDFWSWKAGDGEVAYDFVFFTNVAGRSKTQTLLTVTPPSEVPPLSEVPLPATVFLLIGGVAALGAAGRRKA